MAQVSVQTITPSMANDILSSQAYDKQRNIAPTWMRYLADEMKRGSFKQDTSIEFVKLPNNGKATLIDGYHRLNAVINSGIATRFVIVETMVNSRDEMDRLYYRIDQGKRRNVADQLRVLDFERETGLTSTQLRRLAAAITLIDAGWGSKTLMHFDDRERFVREYAQECYHYFTVTSGRRKEMRIAFERSSTLSVGLVTLKYSVKKYGLAKVEAFWEGVATNDGIAANDSRKFAYEHLLTTAIKGGGGGPMGANVMYTARYSAKYMAHCFNMFVQDKSMRQRPNIDQGAPMLILGSPFNGK